MHYYEHPNDPHPYQYTFVSLDWKYREYAAFKWCAVTLGKDKDRWLYDDGWFLFRDVRDAVEFKMRFG